MKANFSRLVLFSILVFVALLLFSGCSFNFNFSGEGILRVENESEDTIKAFVAYGEDEDGEYVELYRNDGTYAPEGESPVSISIKSGAYADFSMVAGDYDIWFFMVYNGYWYYNIKEDVDVYSSSTTTVTIYTGEWNLLVPSKASSIYNKLPEVVKTSF